MMYTQDSVLFRRLESKRQSFFLDRGSQYPNLVYYVHFRNRTPRQCIDSLPTDTTLIMWEDCTCAILFLDWTPSSIVVFLVLETSVSLRSRHLMNDTSDLLFGKFEVKEVDIFPFILTPRVSTTFIVTLLY